MDVSCTGCCNKLRNFRRMILYCVNDRAGLSAWLSTPKLIKRTASIYMACLAALCVCAQCVFCCLELHRLGIHMCFNLWVNACIELHGAGWKALLTISHGPTTLALSPAPSPLAGNCATVVVNVSLVLCTLPPSLCWSVSPCCRLPICVGPPIRRQWDILAARHTVAVRIVKHALE